MRIAAFNPVRAYLPATFHQRKCRFFAFSVDFNTLAADAVAQRKEWGPDLDFDFLCQELSMVITTDATGASEVTFPEFTVSISSDSGGTQWTDGYVHAGNLFGRMTGDGHGPYVLPYPQFVAGGSTVSVRINNLESTARRVWMEFSGTLIYRNQSW